NAGNGRGAPGVALGCSHRAGIVVHLPPCWTSVTLAKSSVTSRPSIRPRSADQAGDAVGAEAEAVERDAAGHQVEADVPVRDARADGRADARDADVDEGTLHERQVQDEQE